MDEQKKPEVEVKDKAESRVASAVNAVVDDAVKLVDSLGRALMTTAEDVSSLMVIRVDRQTREHLDLLVDAGAAKNRRQAAASLIEEGLYAKHAVFERVRRTKAQIAELRKQMRTLAEAHTP